jgi:DNA (cytosine-5)-methyltransferase 1
MKVLSLFSGIGAFEKALKNLGVDFDLVGFCEIDKYAAKSYCAIHDVAESLNLGDITKVDTRKLPNDIDLVTYGFPCQDISNAGMMKGLFNPDGTPTRSGLFFEALQIIEGTKPKVAIAENVKMLTSKKFATEFKIVLESLEQAGYTNYWSVLNSKDYGIPQNRERVFIVSIRKDVDTGSFSFPTAFSLKARLKDIVKDDVDEKYFVKKELTRKLVINSDVSEPQVFLKDNILLVREATKSGYAEARVGDSINFEHPNSKTRRGRVGKQVAQTLTTSPQQGVVLDGLLIRYFTPRECFRLMGFSDEAFDKAASIVSEQQLYRQAGNSIVVDVLEAIFRQMFDENGLLRV